jgi:hypothetical protein
MIYISLFTVYLFGLVKKDLATLWYGDEIPFTLFKILVQS